MAKATKTRRKLRPAWGWPPPRPTLEDAIKRIAGESEVDKANVVAYLDGRKEHEVLCDPEHVRLVDESEVEGLTEALTVPASSGMD